MREFWLVSDDLVSFTRLIRSRSFAFVPLAGTTQDHYNIKCQERDKSGLMWSMRFSFWRAPRLCLRWNCSLTCPA